MKYLLNLKKNFSFFSLLIAPLSLIGMNQSPIPKINEPYTIKKFSILVPVCNPSSKKKHYYFENSLKINPTISKEHKRKMSDLTTKWINFIKKEKVQIMEPAQANTSQTLLSQQNIAQFSSVRMKINYITTAQPHNNDNCTIQETVKLISSTE